MSLSRRLDAIAQHVERDTSRTQPRCDTCRDWPEIALTYEGNITDLDALWWVKDCPDECPDCGWKPYRRMVVVYDDPALP